MAGYGSSTQPPSLKDLVVRLKKETESDLEGNAVIGIDFGTTLVLVNLILFVGMS